MQDEWTTDLPDGRKVKFEFKQLLSGRIKMHAQVLNTEIELSRIVDHPVKRQDVEGFFLKELL